jgi:hypothetical protein
MNVNVVKHASDVLHSSATMAAFRTFGYDSALPAAEKIPIDR